MNESNLPHADDEIVIAPNLLDALLINGREGKLICFNVGLTFPGKFLNNSPNNVPINL